MIAKHGNTCGIVGKGTTYYIVSTLMKSLIERKGEKWGIIKMKLTNIFIHTHRLHMHSRHERERESEKIKNVNNVCSHECNPIFQYVRDGRIILPLPFLSFSMNRDVKLCVALVLFMGACNAMHSQRRQQRQRFMQQFFVHSHKRDISNCFFVMLLPSTFAYHCQLSLSCLFESCVQSANAI